MDEENMPATKIDNAGSLIIFSGTEGGLDYAMFSMTEGYAIGIKPMLGIGHHSTDFLYRIRAIPYQAPKEDGTVAAPFGVTAEGIAAAFPGFAFSKLSEKRCSLVCHGEHLKDLGAGEIKELITWFEGGEVVTKIMGNLATKLGIDSWENGVEISAWLQNTYIKTLEQVAKNMGVSLTDEETGPATVTNINEAVSEEDVNAEAAELKAETEGDLPLDQATADMKAADNHDGYALDDDTQKETKE